MGRRPGGDLDELHPCHRRSQLFELVAARLADVRALRPAGDGSHARGSTRRLPRRCSPSSAPPAPFPRSGSTEDGRDFALWDTLAIAETLAERHPDRGLWPADPRARALARTLAAEMHAGFRALREACPMNLRRAYTGFAADAGGARRPRADRGALARGARRARRRRPLALRRLLARRRLLRPRRRPHRHLRPAGRRRGATAYVAAHLADPAFLDWRADGAGRPLRPAELRPRPARAPLARARRVNRNATPRRKARPGRSIGPETWSRAPILWHFRASRRGWSRCSAPSPPGCRPSTSSACPTRRSPRPRSGSGRR